MSAVGNREEIHVSSSDFAYTVYIQTKIFPQKYKQQLF